MELLAQKLGTGKNLLIAYYDDETTELPNVLPVKKAITRMVPGVEEAEGDSHDPTSADTVTLCSLMADYTRGSFRQLNHYVPLFHRKKMGEASWTTLVSEQDRRLLKRIQQAEEACADDCSDAEMLESAQDHLFKLQRQHEFNKVMYRMDYLPSHVPADGNCAVWSLLALEGGPVARAQLATKDDVRKAREDTGRVL